MRRWCWGSAKAGAGKELGESLDMEKSRLEAGATVDQSGSLITTAMVSSAGKKWRVTIGEWREIKKKRINAEGAENTEARRGKERFLASAGLRFARTKRKKKPPPL